MPKMTIGKRTHNGKEHVIVYAGKESLLGLLDEAQDTFFNLFEVAAQHGWVSGERFQDLDQSLSHLVIKFDVPQAPE